jgi:glutathione-regulated potassium-efflux system ancillary protein KefC
VVTTVIGSAVVPTLIANALYLPRHLMPDAAEPASAGEPVIVYHATSRAE